MTNTHKLQMAIEGWAVDHGGRYPRSIEEISTVVADKRYMAGGVLGRSPWGGQQVRLLAVAGTGLREAHATPSSPVGTVVGKGRETKVIEVIFDFGAIAYDIDPDGSRYILYGIGKRKGDAAVVITLTGARASGSPSARVRSRPSRRG